MKKIKHKTIKIDVPDIILREISMFKNEPNRYEKKLKKKLEREKKKK